ncbi:MAG: hypothetical protein EXX96DRAFT_567914 [Benjaminiella poitrasii]|nr:MAG: hypothetical protein EXX96DRAFT_567914 [Benjaminiella poitrasii]
MIESPVEKRSITRFAKELVINPHTARNWRKTYQKDDGLLIKKLKCTVVDVRFKATKVLIFL